MTRSIEQIKTDYPTVQKCRTEIGRLNKELKKFGVKEPLTINGLEIPISKSKAEHNLPDHISKLEALLVTYTNKTVETKPQTETETTTTQTVETSEKTTEETTTPQTVEDTENDYTDSEQEKRFIAKRLYSGIKKKDDEDEELIGLKEYRL